MNPLDRLTTIISKLMGKEPDDPEVLKAVVDVVMAIRTSSEAMRKAVAFGNYTTVSYGVEDSFDYISEENAADLWQAMIDALLTDVGEGR